jgi:hypothetical protein
MAKDLITDEMNKEELALFAMDLMHRSMVHHVFWFKEVEHQMGFEAALAIMEEAYEKSRQIQLKRLSKILGFQLENGIPSPLLSMPRETLTELIEGLGINWLAGDGVWFQAVEASRGMGDAKRCNDSCWAWFSPFEAWSIKRFLNMEETPGLVGLQKALAYRLYAQINEQSIVNDGPDSFIFQMNHCRVQAARKSKGMEDYPCKSAGLVEYTNFAKAIDSRIQTQCVACPPDLHPDDWFCAWRFSILEKGEGL